MQKRELSPVTNLVIKIGSSLLTDGGSVSYPRVERIVDAVARVKREVANISLVSSGAIACGFKQLGFTKRPASI
ncbi:MAG: hypothetical protein LBP51_08220, partial [Deferribacteraceae bacterium]|nr:hypothetical protein [Deferribacteraceae bacterium]